MSEGAVTEKQYLGALKRSLRISSARLEFVPPGPTSPIQIVEKARQLALHAKRDDPFDEVWCIFDVEARVGQECREGLDEAIQKAQAWNISLAVSNPCIELWILLHREDHCAWIDSHACQKRCASLQLTTGKHLSDADGLYSDFDNARRHAIALDTMHSRNGKRELRDKNPSSALYKLVDAVLYAFTKR